MAAADGATPTGAQNREGGYLDESEDRELTPREEALRAIAARRMGALAEEIVEGGGAAPQFGVTEDPDDVAAEADDADARRRGETPPVAAAPKPAPRAAPAPARAKTVVDEQLERQGDESMRFDGDASKTLIRVKVDGEEMELPLDRVVANYQKVATADRRLEEATRLRREAQALSEGGTASPPAAPVAAPASVNPEAFTSALFEGDTAQAGTALQALIDAGVAKALEGRADATPVDVAEVTNSVKQQIEWDQKWMASKERYPVMYDDPDVHAVAVSKMQTRINEGMSPEDALIEVETNMAKSFGWKSAATGRTTPRTPTPPVLNDRLERKRQLSQTPVATARRNESQEDAEPLMDARDRAVRGIEFLRSSRPGQTADA